MGLVFALLVGCVIQTRIQMSYWHDGIALFTRATSVTKANWVALLNLGDSLIEKGKFEQAVACFDAALKLAPENPHILRNLAGTLVRQRLYPRAIECYERALASGTRLPDVYLGLASVLCFRGDKEARNGERAVQYALLACALRGEKDPIYLSILAAAYAEKGEFKRASDIARQGLGFAPQRLQGLHAQLGLQARAYGSARCYYPNVQGVADPVTHPP
jgi:tetratricopeptide (TPR) repeat protein